MTKLEALTCLEMWVKHDTDLLNNCQMDTQENIDIYNIAIECIQHCIDEDDDPCYDCDHSHCNNCLYSGRMPE